MDGVFIFTLVSLSGGRCIESVVCDWIISYDSLSSWLRVYDCRYACHKGEGICMLMCRSCYHHHALYRFPFVLVHCLLFLLCGLRRHIFVMNAIPNSNIICVLLCRGCCQHLAFYHSPLLWFNLDLILLWQWACVVVAVLCGFVCFVSCECFSVSYLMFSLCITHNPLRCAIY